jgi:putative serine protease PepD
VDAAGEVIGINSAIAGVAPQDVRGQQSGQGGNIGVGFAIPSNTAQRIADEIISVGQATHALLGVSTRTAAENPEVALGAQIVQVQPGSPAAGAGLRPGDVVTAVDDHVVATSTDLTAYVRSAEPGQQATLTVQRDGSTSVDLTLAAAPS